jgi:DNA-binding NtrC family response regulator
MPGMNGGELAVEIKRRRPSMPVVLLSGHSAVVENPPNSVDAALPKGAPLDRLFELIDTLRERSRRVGTLRPLLPLGEALASVAVAAFLIPRILK